MKKLVTSLSILFLLLVSYNLCAQKWDDAFVDASYSGSPVIPRDIVEYNGDLYVAGRWSSSLQSYIAKWDGTTWSAVGSGFVEDTGFDRGIYTLEVFDGELYAGGYFTIDINATLFRGVAKWNGTEWQPLTDFAYGLSSKVYDFQLWNSNIIIGGEFSGTFGGSTTNASIIGFNGTNWVEFNEGLTNNNATPSVRSITVHNNDLIVAGTFNRDVPTLSFYNKVAQWDGTNQVWLDMPAFFNSGSYNYTKIQSYGANIYVYAEPVNISNQNYVLYKYDFINDIIGINTVSAVQGAYSRLASLTDMIVFDGNLVVSGSYLDSSFGGQSSDIQIETYDGTTWNRALPEGASANALGVFDGRLTTGSSILNDPSVEVIPSETELCVNVTTNFSLIDYSSTPVNSITWTFEGGTPASSNDVSPDVSYASAGTFDVSISVTSNDGTTELTFPDMITVGDEFVVDAGSDETINYGDELTLVGTPSGGTWSGTPALQGNLFDGGYSSGEFEVTYTVTQGGCTKSDTKLITVEKNDPGAYDFSSIPNDLIYPVADGIVLPYISSNVMYSVIEGSASFNLSNITTPTLNITGAGSITIEVTQPATISTFERTDQFTFSVAKGDHTTSINSISERPFGEVFILHFGPGLDFESSAGAGVPTGLYDINIISGPATASNESILQEITVTGVGTVTFEIVNLGNDNWNPAPTVQGTFEAVKASQTVTVSNNLLNEYPYSKGTIDFSELVVSSTDQPVVFIITEGPGFFNGDGMDQYNFVTTGQVTISAFASSNENYLASPNVDIVFTVIKGNQMINWQGFEEVVNELPSSITYQPEGYTPIANSDSELTIDYSVVSGDGAINNDGKFIINTSGVFVLKATQVGNENWNEASQDYSFTVNKSEQTISFDPIEDKVRDVEGFTFTPTATSGLEVAVQTSGRTTYDGGILTYNTSAPSGEEQVTLNQRGNENYLPANQEVITFCISAPAPVLSIGSQNSSGIVITSDNLVDTHEFFLNGASIGTYTGASFSFSETGTYSAIALAQDGCSSSQLSNEIAFEILSTELEDGIFVYPNPSHIFLSVDSKSVLEIQIYGLDGKLYLSGSVSKGNPLNVQSLMPGQYIVHLLNDEEVVYSGKILKVN